MALLLRFSAVKLYEGQASGSKSDLSLDVSMIETNTEEHSVQIASEGTDGNTATVLVDGLLSPLRNLPSHLTPPVNDQCLAY